MPRAAKSTQRASKHKRLEARVTPAQKRLIERAAELRGTTVTDFVVASAQRAATETIKDFETLRLQNKSSEVFVNAVLNPQAPAPAARTAARRYKQHMGL